MPFTLLDVVNRVMRRQRLINATSEQLTDFSDTALRPTIDSVIDAINDTFRTLFDLCEILPYRVTEGTLTLVAGQREYAMPADFAVMASNHLKDHEKGHTVYHMQGGYKAMFEQQETPDNYEGQPDFWVINPTNAQLRFDRIPDSSLAGDVYTYIYSKQINYDAATDAIDSDDMVTRDLIPAIVQMYRREHDPERYDEGVFLTALSLAAATLSKRPVSDHYAQTSRR